MPLKKTLGLAGLTFYGVGIILGAGIYSVLGVAAGEAGDALWMAFVASGFVALLTAFSYAELATSYPKAGAEFAYLRHALPKWPAVALVTGLLVAASGAATSATVSIAFASYLRSFVELPPSLIAWALLALALAVNVAGVKEAGWVNATFTLLEAGGLLLFAGLGATTGAFADAFSAAPNAGIAPAAALVFFSFLGFENIANLAEESREPRRDLPRAIFLSLGIAVTLYVLVALAAVALMPADELAKAEAPLADAARAHSPRIAGALGGIALFATANTALVSMLVSSRVVYGIAREKELPAALAKLLPGRDTPWLATLVVAALSASLVPFGEVGVVASMSSFASLLAFAAVNLAVILLRRQRQGGKGKQKKQEQQEQEEPFRAPGAVAEVPVLPALGVVATLGVATQLERDALIGGAAALVFFSAYALWRHRSS